jgi:hypothetical protein
MVEAACVIAVDCSDGPALLKEEIDVTDVFDAGVTRGSLGLLR